MGGAELGRGANIDQIDNALLLHVGESGSGNGLHDVSPVQLMFWIKACRQL
jgi:hypothetical protein